MLKPIRSGTVKAQAKGIIRDIHNNGNTTLGRHSLRAGMTCIFSFFVLHGTLSETKNDGWPVSPCFGSYLHSIC